MTTTVTKFRSLLNIDNRFYLVNLEQWANRRLSGDELTQFRQDMLDIHQFYSELTANGTITNDEIYISPKDGEGGEIYTEIVWRAVFKDEHIWHPTAPYWEAKFAADPALVHNPIAVTKDGSTTYGFFDGTRIINIFD